MRPRSAARLAWALWTLAALLMVIATAMLWLNGHGPDLAGISLWLSFATVGALVSARRPRNAIGWLFLAQGFYVPLLLSAQEYARYAFAATNPMPGGNWAAWLGVWPVELGLPLLCLVFLLFPDGHFLSAPWRWLGWVEVSIAAVGTAASALADVNFTHNFPHVEHPLQILPKSVAAPVYDAWQGVALILLLASATSLIVRLRRARGDERQQVKWFTYSSAILAVAFVGFAVATPEPSIAFAVLAPLLPISAGLAIAKYHLYDIDVIINRTLVYGVLTALLLLTYIVGVFAIGAVLRTIVGETRGNNNLAVAASTLAVAALFRPGRARIQRLIDRRFYRSKYDAVKTLEAFSMRLRDEVDLETLGSEMLSVVNMTVQPSLASLWLLTPKPGMK